MGSCNSVNSSTTSRAATTPFNSTTTAASVKTSTTDNTNFGLGNKQGGGGRGELSHLSKSKKISSPSKDKKMVRQLPIIQLISCAQII
jgi:hypothetical protein